MAPRGPQALIWHADDLRVAERVGEGVPSPFTFREADAWLALAVGQAPAFDFAIEAVGSISLRIGEDEHRNFGEITLWIGRDFWGRGIGTEAARAITYYSLERFGLQHIYAVVFASNAAAVRVFEKNEYVLQGRLPEGVRNRGQVMEGLVYAFVVEGRAG